MISFGLPGGPNSAESTFQRGLGAVCWVRTVARPETKITPLPNLSQHQKRWETRCFIGKLQYFMYRRCAVRFRLRQNGALRARLLSQLFGPEQNFMPGVDRIVRTV